MARAIMIQGAGSNVGKSILVAGIARAAVKRGISAAPFKPQNMSNNAAVTADGGEIGRAQALQAMACNLAPSIHMNPVLLKPETDIGSQVVVQGRYVSTVKAREYGAMKVQLLPSVLNSFHKLAKEHDLILVEGAGSPAEVNLRAGDIANMGFAEAANIPVAIIGDIDRGGVIAQLVGTHVVLPPEDRARICAFAINKFRGDVSLFDGGMSVISEQTGWAPLGVVPWFEDAWRLPAEDIMDIASKTEGSLKIAVPRLNRIANFDDLDPLAAMPDVQVQIVKAGEALPGDADLVLIPGSKSTISDLAHFRAQGWDIDLHAHIRRGGHVLGICGGYQMLGRKIADPQGIEGAPCEVEGLGLLDVETVLHPKKRVCQTKAVHLASHIELDGYEIHLGRTDGPDCAAHWLTIDGRPEGASAHNGRVKGCYLHGLFSNDSFRQSYLKDLSGFDGQTICYSKDVEETLDRLAAHLEAYLDLELLFDKAAQI